LPHVTIPVEQAWDLVLVHHIQNFSNYHLSASRTRGRRARRCLVPKTTERQRDLVGRSVHESADLARFFPGEPTACYGKDTAHVWTCSAHHIAQTRSTSHHRFHSQKRFPFISEILFPCPGTPLRRFHSSFAPAHFSSSVASSVHSQPPFPPLFLGPTPLECRCGLKSPD
jgi:hypothetical protein